MRFYEIAREYRELCSELEDSESGELTEEVAAKFAGLSDGLEKKARAIVSLMAELNAEAKAAAEESKRVAAIAKSKTNAAERLRAYLLECLQNAGIQKIDVGIAKLSVQKASRPSIRWVKEEPIPEEFERWAVALDGQKVYDEWKATGKLPEGFSIEWTTFLGVR